MLTEKYWAEWDANGFLVLPGFFSHEQVERVNTLVESLFRAPPSYLIVENTINGRRYRLADVPAAKRSPRMFKLSDLYLEHPEIRDLALSDRVQPVLAELLGEPVTLCNSLNLEKGSQQPEHIDSLFMTPRTPGKLAATWIALEDAHPDAGQLFYHPGSHKIPLFTFSDGSHHYNDAELPKWHQYIRAKLTEASCRREQFAAKKGDLFIWHANLVHGGSAIRDPNRTRKSLVCHYYTISDCMALGCDCVPVGDNGFWMRRAHPPLPDAGAIPFRRRVGKLLRRLGLYSTVKKLVG